MHPLSRLGLIANRVLRPRYLVPAAIAIGAALLLMGCADPYLAPPARPGLALWRTDTAADVARTCGDANAEACAIVIGRTCIITTRVPDRMDTGFGEVAAHEWAHCGGWRHRDWPNQREARK